MLVLVLQKWLYGIFQCHQYAMHILFFFLDGKVLSLVDGTTLLSVTIFLGGMEGTWLELD